ncbi:MAG: HlyD family secretion protein [Nitrospirae bacterium]|nr:HlyD family secretion protein [Nitrospirota bacterium]MCL5423202.1 HlyD family secretion protein [Nitrospirota bacterium]
MDEIKQPEAKQSNNHRRNVIALGVFVVIAVIGAIAVFFYIQYKNTHIATDDAFVEGRIHVIASKVYGTVKAVYVNDNQPVKRGDLLLNIDPVDYDVKMNEASSRVNAETAKIVEINARVEAAKKQVLEAKAAVETARANLDLQEANLRQAEIDIKRAENLYRNDALSRERYEKTMTGHKVVLAQVKAAGEQLKQAEAALETQKAFVRQAEAARTAQRSSVAEKQAVLKTAELNYGYTKLYAPSDGYVTKKSVEVGNQIQAGQALMAVVPLDDVWLIANYKETQLEKVKAGQKVEIKVDSYPGKKFRGKVDSIMAGTGSTFSLFPPENATGNYVKVVQRVPVKILLEKGTDPDHVLRVGMSVVPTILVEK